VCSLTKHDRLTYW
ncbi:eamA-like transporter family protein, partial [Vibrio cholerae HC-17A1]